MTIDEISEMWEKDGKIDPLNLSGSSIDTPMIHNKYEKLHAIENIKLKKARAMYDELCQLKMEYYRGELDDETLKYYKWEPFRLKILKSDAANYLKKDKDIKEATIKIGIQEEIVQYLYNILRQINNRGYLIKNAIDDIKFKAGM